MNERAKDPLFGDVPKRIILKNAPLIRVLAQVRFPIIMKISDEIYIRDFQEAMRGCYPHLQKDLVQSIEVKVDGANMQHKTIETTAWRFFDQERVIRVTLNNNTISIETARYISRNDFLQRLKFVLEALEKTIKPAIAERIGFRYVNRIQGAKSLSILSELIQPELMNVSQQNLMEHIVYSMTDIHCRTNEGALIARYGFAPSNITHDPEMAPAINEESWVLDIDSSSTSCSDESFSSERLRNQFDMVAARAYAFFRWSIKDQFIEHLEAAEL